MKRMINNHQYHLATKNLQEIDTLVKLLKQRNYRILHNLENVLSFKEIPIGICIDNGFEGSYNGKCVFQSNITCMACFCSWSGKKPLYVKDVIDNIEKLIDELDVEFYNCLLDKGSKKR